MTRLPTCLSCVLVAMLCALSACSSTDVGAAPPAPTPARVEPSPPRELQALLYRRLAWSPEMRHRYWIDEIYVPELRVAFNLRTDNDVSDGSLRFIPALNAFVADAPIRYSNDLYGRDVVEPQVAEIRIPADLARHIRAQADMLDTLHASERVLGLELDRTEVLPAVVGSARWRPEPPAE